MLSRVRAGERFTPPSLSDSEDNRPSTSGVAGSKSPVPSTSHAINPVSEEREYPEGYIPRTPGRTSDEEGSDGGIEMASNTDTPMDVHNPTGNKRPADEAGSSGTGKKVKGDRTKLPGTGKPQSLESGADRTEIYIARPLNPKTIVLTTFVKQHKFLTFGIASKILPVEIAAVPNSHDAHTIYYGTTALAQIPVHKPILYMNPSEFNLLPNGAEILEVTCKIVQRNALLSFQTNASTSALATLNQNKNGVYCIGLNKTGYGMDRRYVAFDANEPMIPTQTAPAAYAFVANPAYEGLSEDLYGVNNDNVNFAGSLPKHQFGQFTTIKNYFCMTQTDKYRGGWPNLQSKIVEYDAGAMVGEQIIHYKYNPVMSPIKPPQDYLPCQIPQSSNQQYNHNAMQSEMEVIQINQTGQTFNNLVYSKGNRNKIDVVYDQYTDIEKSQHLIRGIGGHIKPQIQPSLHVGIQPVPALTTKSIVSGDTNSNFTDTRSYFDVHCTCTVGFRMHTDRPFATDFNCAAGEVIRQSSFPKPNSDSVAFAGLYGDDSVPEN